jgi:hypothetical protein
MIEKEKKSRYRQNGEGGGDDLTNCPAGGDFWL